MLPLRPFGKTGLMISPLGLGTVKLGRNKALKYPQPFDLPTDAQAADLLRAAQKRGVTLLDTAPAYGEAQERLGRILGACGGRDRWTIVTKAGEHFDPDTGISTFDFSPRGIIDSVERSMKHLRTDRLDAVLIHSDGDDERILRDGTAFDALARFKRRGRVRCVGMSTKTAAGGLLAVNSGRCDVVMLTLNARHDADLPAIREAGKRGVGVLIKKAFESGAGVAPDEALERCYAEPGVSCVVVGTLRAEHLEQNAAAAERILGLAGFARATI